MIGNILSNRYRILQELGIGGMAKVYLAEDINEGQMVAVKVLHPQFGEDVAYLQRFKREAKLASLLNNPHIVRVLDYGSSRDTHYLVMEYVEGKDLRQVIDEHGPFAWEEALKMIDQICAALENANNYNIVHRDIKPQNVMQTERGILKVLDFGIARARMLPSLTQSGFVGSPYYISPEQAMGEDVDIRSDIYSTGIVLYELLTGHVPFDSKSPWSIISKHIASEFPTFDLKDMKVPTPVQSLLEYMVAKRPEDRFQSPTAVRKAIAAALAGEDVTLAPATPTITEIDKPAMARSLFHRAEEALAVEEWQKAVNLLNQVLSLNPNHPQAAQKLSFAGTQARLAALYKAARQAMEANRWQEAVDELTEIVNTDASYRDSAQLLEQAQEALQQEALQLRLPELYAEAMDAFEAGDYKVAEERFARIKDISPGYRKADALWAESRRRSSQTGAFRRLQALQPKPGSTPSVRWLALTALLIIAIVAAVFAIGRNSPPPPTPPPSPGKTVRPGATGGRTKRHRPRQQPPQPDSEP